MAWNKDILILKKITKVRAHDSFLKCFTNYSDFKSLDSSHLAAAGQGFEPRYSPPKGDVLPLDDPAISDNFNILPQNKLFFKQIFSIIKNLISFLKQSSRLGVF